VDYAVRSQHVAQFFLVNVTGERRGAIQEFAPGYAVTLSQLDFPVGREQTVNITVAKDGSGVTDLRPYLGAAMHLAIIKSDLTSVMHTHGEVHGVSLAQGHHHAAPPQRFGPTVEAHLNLTAPGEYIIFAEFRHTNLSVARFYVSANS
jgi:hypothetical protein